MSKINLQDAFQTPFQLIGKVPLVLIPSLIASLIGLALSIGVRNAYLAGMRWQVFVVAIISNIIVLFSMGWITLLLEKAMQEEKVSLQDSWIKLSERLPNLGVAALVVSILVALGTFLYIIPGILLASILLPAIPHAAKENVSFDKSISFSLNFVFSQGNFGAVFLMVLIEFLLGLLPVIGLFLANLFISIWLPYAVVKYGTTSAEASE
ncbi:MAG: hypothetical protein J7J32_05135 [Candidatus Atribacteria bacterium]|nr:hypothetical protein [Candidatus Atribacteria bacterium]MCD6349292.1 hypothetical protein [Candidatus Atribacteria bacterium]